MRQLLRHVLVTISDADLFPRLFEVRPPNLRPCGEEHGDANDRHERADLGDGEHVLQNFASLDAEGVPDRQKQNHANPDKLPGVDLKVVEFKDPDWLIQAPNRKRNAIESWPGPQQRILASAKRWHQ